MTSSIFSGFYWMKRILPLKHQVQTYLGLQRQIVLSKPNINGFTNSFGGSTLKRHKHQSTIDVNYRVRGQNEEPHGSDKTTVNIMNQDTNLLMVDSFSIDGFRLNSGQKVFGPIVIFPTAVLNWNIKSLEDVSEASMCLFTMLEPKPSVVFIGYGEKTDIDAKILEDKSISLILRLNQRGLNVELMPTSQAISAYNFLSIEGRLTAAALIPPSFVSRLSDADAHDMKTSITGGAYDTNDDNFFGLKPKDGDV